MCLRATYAGAICLAQWFADVACAAQVSYACTDASMYIACLNSIVLCAAIEAAVYIAHLQCSLECFAKWLCMLVMHVSPGDIC